MCIALTYLLCALCTAGSIHTTHPLSVCIWTTAKADDISVVLESDYYLEKMTEDMTVRLKLKGATSTWGDAETVITRVDRTWEELFAAEFGMFVSPLNILNATNLRLHSHHSISSDKCPSICISD